MTRTTSTYVNQGVGLGRNLFALLFKLQRQLLVTGQDTANSLTVPYSESEQQLQ